MRRRARRARLGSAGERVVADGRHGPEIEELGWSLVERGVASVVAPTATADSTGAPGRGLPLARERIG
jgi:hypothetical protein